MSTRGLFRLRTDYDNFKIFECPLNVGFWHYSQNGCILYIDEATQSIHHLYRREICSLTKDGRTIEQLLRSQQNRDVDESRHYNIICEPYINMNSSYDYAVNHNVVQSMSKKSIHRLNTITEMNLQQYWSVRFDTRLNVPELQNTNMRQNQLENVVQRRVLENINTPFIFFTDVQFVTDFISMVTTRFFHEQMTVINSIGVTRLLNNLIMNIKFIDSLPAQQMIRVQPNPNLLYMDGRDLFDVVQLGETRYMTNLRPIHIANEMIFLDTWRRTIFNFVQELVNLHDFSTKHIRVRSACSVLHFLDGNNGIVIPEFRCNTDNISDCPHLQARRLEFQMRNPKQSVLNENIFENNYHLYGNNNLSNTSSLPSSSHTIDLNEQGPICKHVLKVMVDEYSANDVDRVLKFDCFFTRVIYEPNGIFWERIVAKNLDKNLRMPYNVEGSGLARARITCLQKMCNQTRMNDIHRFCLPSRFLTMHWFHWVCKKMNIPVFPTS